MNQRNTSTHVNRKNFIVINEGFVCDNCNKENPPLKGGCRNHCRYCLYSKHVDDGLPGDRKSSCLSLMEPFEVDSDGKKGFIIMHKCMKCGKETRNKAASDDNFDVIIKLSRNKQV